MYSRPHFDPEKSWTSASSAGLIAAGLYRSLQKVGFDLTYIDPSEIASIRGQKFDLFIGQNLYWTRVLEACLAKFKILFMPVVNPVQRMHEMKEAAKRSGKEPEVFPKTDLSCFQKCDAIFQIGNDFAVQALLDEGVPAQKVIHLHYGLKPHFLTQKNSEERSKNFLYLSSGINLAKGFPFLRDLWERVRVPGARLKIVGKIYHPSFERDVKDFISDPNSCAEYYGFIPSEKTEYWEVLSQSGWLLFPTIGEAEPGTVMEALGCGVVPLIHAEKAGIGFHVLNDFSVGLEEQCQHIKELLLNDSFQWELLSRKARKHAEIFYSVDSWEKRLEQLFTNLKIHGKLSAPRLWTYESSCFSSLLSTQKSLLGPKIYSLKDLSEVFPPMSDQDYLLVKPQIAQVPRFESILCALNFLEEHPHISSLSLGASFSERPTVAQEIHFLEVSQVFKIVRLSHVSTNKKILGADLEFIPSACHFLWKDQSEFKTLDLESAKVTVPGPKLFKSGLLRSLNLKRFLNRAEYHRCPFVKEF